MLLFFICVKPAQLKESELGFTAMNSSIAKMCYLDKKAQDEFAELLHKHWFCLLSFSKLLKLTEGYYICFDMIVNGNTIY